MRSRFPALYAAASTTPQLVAGQVADKSVIGTPDSQLILTPTLPQGCTSGDALIAMVTIEQDTSSHVGEVTAVPSGWQRLFEHTPTDGSAYQGWFALPNCSAGANSPSFVVASPDNSYGTIASVVLGEYSGLPATLQAAFDDNDGAMSGTSDTLNTTGSTSGELVLTALSFDPRSNPSASAVTGDNWQAGGSFPTSASMSAFVSWEVSSSSQPTANFSWSPSAPYEVTMLGLEAGSTNENLVQEGRSSISSGGGTVTLPDGVATHDALVAVIDTNTSSAYGSGYQATSIAGGGVTWTRVVGAGGSGSETSEIWAGLDSSGTSGATPVTASLPSADVGDLTVSELSGVAAVSANNNWTTGSGGTPAVGVTPSQANDLFVAGMASDPSLNQHPQPNWSSLPETSGAPTFAAEWLANGPGSHTTPSWDLYSSGYWVAVLALFTPASPPTDAAGSTTPISATTATLNGSVSPGGTDTSFFFRYGNAAGSYGAATTPVDLSQTSGSVPVAASLGGLTPGTTYHAQLVAWSAGGFAYGPDQIFTTLSLPSATTAAGGAVASTTATLNGVVDPNGSDTTFFFQYGTSTSYGTTTAVVDAGSGSSGSAVSANVTGLTPSTSYHYRVVAMSVAGTTDGLDRSLRPQRQGYPRPRPRWRCRRRSLRRSSALVSLCTRAPL